jgi:hypothetical protein
MAGMPKIHSKKNGSVVGFFIPPLCYQGSKRHTASPPKFSARADLKPNSSAAEHELARLLSAVAAEALVPWVVAPAVVVAAPYAGAVANVASAVPIANTADSIAILAIVLFILRRFKAQSYLAVGQLFLVYLFHTLFITHLPLQCNSDISYVFK